MLARLALLFLLSLSPAAHAAFGGLLGGDAEPLPPDQAFSLTVSAKDGRNLAARFEPTKGYYLYRDKVAFQVSAPPEVKVAGVDLPPGEVKNDPNFGPTAVFHQPFDATVRLDRPAGGPITVTVKARYQGCADAGLCYPPIDKVYTVSLPGADQAAAVPARPAGGAPGGGTPVAGGDESSAIARVLGGGSFFTVVAFFFTAGLLLSFTPCVLPMIPILSGIIVGQGHKVTRMQGFLLSLSYVLGMALTYTAAGVAAGLSGTLLTAALQDPRVLVSFALVFVVLSFSMFGFYELQLPASLQSRLADTSNRMHGGHHAAVFGMGMLSAVIVGPCVAAPLAGALLYIGTTRDVVLGGSALFSMALGMGVPLLLVGASAGTLLPKAGAWMNSVKSFFGVLLLAVAIWMVSPLLPPVAHMLAWAVLLICSAIYLHAIDPLPVNASGFRKLWKGVGVIALLVGGALLLGALAGGRDPLQPLAGFRAAGAGPVAAAEALPFRRVSSLAELDARVAEARGRYVMLDFYADWCVSCKEMERFTFADPAVQARLAQVTLLQADVTANNEEHKALLKRFGLYGPPGIIFFDPSGAEVTHYKVIGFQDAKAFLASLDAVMGASVQAGQAATVAAR